jgi:hypothetical protein
VKPELEEKHSADLNTLRGVVGARIACLARSRYIFNGTPQEGDDGELELLLYDGRRVVLSLAADGESVKAEERPLRLPPSFTLEGGATCAWERVDLSAIEPFTRFVGMPVLAIEAIVDTWRAIDHQSLAGWVVRSPVGVLTYCNQGDDSRIGLDLPPPYEQAETATEEIGSKRGAG